LALVFSLVRGDVDVAWMSSMAHRLWELPNPYESVVLPPHDSPLAPGPPPMPEPAGSTRYFAIEDSADMMGLTLSRNVLVGFQVEFVGPGEEPLSAQQIILPRDPNGRRFLMPTGGVRVRF
jgi:hypothetical protein